MKMTLFRSHQVVVRSELKDSAKLTVSVRVQATVDGIEISDKTSKRLHAFAANEALLIHGTNLEVAQKIAEQGFDPRHLQGIYGRGIYFTHDF